MVMQRLYSLWIFYRRIIFLSMFMSLIISLSGYFFQRTFSLKAICICWVILCPLVHYFIYDLLKPEEYIFYHNLGLTRHVLWYVTIISSFLLTLFLLHL